MRTRPALPAVVTALLVSLAAPMAEAAPPAVHPFRVRTGQRVRLWSASQAGTFQRTGATVTATDYQGLTVVIKDRTELVSFGDLSRLDVRRGWRHLRRGAFFGLLIGAAAGAIAERHRDADDVLEAAAIGGGIGAAVGTATAAALWPARWHPIDLAAVGTPAVPPPPPPVPVGDLGPPRGQRLALAFTFSL